MVSAPRMRPFDINANNLHVNFAATWRLFDQRLHQQHYGPKRLKPAQQITPVGLQCDRTMMLYRNAAHPAKEFTRRLPRRLTANLAIIAPAS
jgi:hypothetical protein